MKRSFKQANFLGKNIKKLIIAWLKSDFRQKLLDFRYFYLMRFFSQKCKTPVFLALSDPQSLILIQVLAQLEKRYDIEFELNLISGMLSADVLEPQQWRQWSLADANVLAVHYQLKTITEYPQQKDLVTGQQLWQIQRRTLEDACNIFCKTWYGGFSEHFPASTPVINSQFKNQYTLSSKGHYLAGTILFCGEWFLGIDRLEHFERKLIKLGLSQKEKSDVCYPKPKLQFLPAIKNKNQLEKSINSDSSTAITAYISLRSPYSYLGFTQVKQLAEHYQVELIIKPILPLVMRDYPISTDKMRYIFLDTIREAKLLNIPFEDFEDPLGQGVINCYQLFAYAQQQNKADSFMEKTYRAIYVEGIDLTKLNNLQKLCQQLDLDFQAALAFDLKHPWQQWAQQNLTELEKLDFWGVPCFVFQDVKVWGQDRLWQIEKAMIES